jgi:hypothetical protein
MNVSVTVVLAQDHFLIVVVMLILLTLVKLYVCHAVINVPLANHQRSIVYLAQELIVPIHQSVDVVQVTLTMV